MIKLLLIRHRGYENTNKKKVRSAETPCQEQFSPTPEPSSGEVRAVTTLDVSRPRGELTHVLKLAASWATERVCQRSLNKHAKKEEMSLCVKHSDQPEINLINGGSLSSGRWDGRRRAGSCHGSKGQQIARNDEKYQMKHLRSSVAFLRTQD